MKAIDERYKNALIEEYESYSAAGRKADAEGVAKVLREQYDHDVAAEAEPAAKVEASAVPERADAEKPPEAAVEPKPRRGRPPKAAGDKAGE